MSSNGYSIINLRNANEIFQECGLVFTRHNFGYYVASIDGDKFDEDKKLTDLVKRVAGKLVSYYKDVEKFEDITDNTDCFVIDNIADS